MRQGGSCYHLHSLITLLGTLVYMIIHLIIVAIHKVMQIRVKRFS